MKVCKCSLCGCHLKEKDWSNRLQYRVDEVADVLGVSVSMVKTWIRSKALVSYTMGKVRCIAKEDVERFVNQHRADGPFDTAA
ncbi:hypothetical protein CEE69_29145 [Rhodopirellula bahusiensis]|uniref:Helix-turn-helix domain-containing protein n=1 Tax=Rhodopirellula bahusiensis TaxID=2014065 RepID=A0A2G1VYH9_9BACT|nr:hypothetical protein CEE69_29145 [Rhodopirellula bahusiensis]